MDIYSCMFLILNVTHHSLFFRESGINRICFGTLHVFQRSFQPKGEPGRFLPLSQAKETANVSKRTLVFDENHTQPVFL